MVFRGEELFSGVDFKTSSEIGRLQEGETGAGRAGSNTNLKGAVIFTTFLRLL